MVLFRERPYVGFKVRATRLASLIVTDRDAPKEEAATRLIEITSNAWEEPVRKRTLDEQTANDTHANIRRRHQKQNAASTPTQKRPK
jgi:hypothetical protein